MQFNYAKMRAAGEEPWAEIWKEWRPWDGKGGRKELLAEWHFKYTPWLPKKAFTDGVVHLYAKYKDYPKTVKKLLLKGDLTEPETEFQKAMKQL